jgi:hypothetical protein
MAGSACSLAPVVIQQTVVVTATVEPTLVPSNTLVPPSNTPVPPTKAPTKPPIVPTLPQLVVEAIPGQLKAQILHPDYFEGAHTSLNFQVKAYDPDAGNKDGAGIKNVEFHISDQDGNELWKQVEQNVPYCAFGGDNPCPVYVFAQHGNKWPNGQPIQNGTYTLQVNVHAQNGDKDENDQIDFDVRLGK